MRGGRGTVWGFPPALHYMWCPYGEEQKEDWAEVLSGT